MMNPFHDVVWSPGLAEKRKFAVSFMIGFPALAAFFSMINWLGGHPVKPFLLYAGVAGFALGAVLWLVPSIAKPVYVAWYFLACCIGFVIGNLLFSLFFFLVFTPLGLLKRCFSKPAFRKGFDKNALSYWQEAEKGIDIERYYRQF